MFTLKSPVVRLISPFAHATRDGRPHQPDTRPEVPSKGRPFVSHGARCICEHCARRAA